MDNSSIVMELGSLIYQTFSFLDVIFSTIAAIIVIYLFFSKRKAIASIYHFLVNYSIQISLKELETKFDKLNEYNADDSIHRNSVINILNEIIGQMRGNPILALKCKLILKKLSEYEENPDILTEPKKRSLISELRETLRNINIQSYDELLGEKHE